ncbi:MAG: four helix bundle protein [Lacunisphaera sp.]
MRRNFDLEERLLEYAAGVVRFTEKTSGTRTGTHIAGQLLRSGTSPLPNHAEAQAAESTADFIHKMSICLKELREVRRWLLLIQRVPLTKTPSAVEAPLKECEELIRIFFISIRTAKKRTSSPKVLHGC